ncbi:BQ5605_C005g03201 [Microbotryum silenes-dioicae]|uniref:BQ5605_C005g03201 protein n=1 Tax=Microbotryum silenes-dioicae TaxID=796604 RepID=A0A2X0MDB5_9BASI|nr:BQ5605_C005g03201 [Microbotryum silenes-dioicae]
MLPIEVELESDRKLTRDELVEKEEEVLPWVKEDGLVAKGFHAARSIAQEHFTYFKVLPSLTPAARAHFPEFHSLYPSGLDGGFYVFVWEEVGKVVSEAGCNLEMELNDKISGAFETIAENGIHHEDEEAPERGGPSRSANLCS